jgi:EmrB/QacA subfamily drug resistance transporter
MGLGAAFVMPATLSILNAVFPPRERAQAIAVWSGVAGVGIIVGPTLGGFLLAHFFWGSVFLVNVPIVVVALVGVLSVVPETAEARGRALDIVGTLLVGGALVAVVDAIIEAPIRGWTGGATLAEAAAGLGMLALFVWWEMRVPVPLIDLRVFSSRAFTAATASVTVIFFSLFGSLFVFTQYLQLVHGYSPLSAGIRALPFALATGVASPLSPLLAKRFGNRTVISSGLGLMGLGLLYLSTARVGTGYPALALAVAIMGAGMGLVMAPASSTIMTAVPAHQAGAGSAVNSTVREVGGTLGVAIVGSLAAAVYRNRLTAELVAHHTPGFVVHAATGSIAAADAVGRSIGGVRGGEILQAAQASFTTAMSLGMRVAGAVSIVSALAALVVIPRSPRRVSDTAPREGRELVVASSPA